ncbi:MAG: aspartate dehydrogenase [Oscillospiraceae bacterium]|nr:aspartate dehydrogenase [Oscillospiraceae bacterium]
MLFGRRKAAEPVFPREDYEPLIRCSICTGEQVGCVRERKSGRLIEVMLLRTGADREAFCRRCGVREEEIKKIY